MQVDLVRLKERIQLELDRLEQKRSRLREELRLVDEVERIARDFEDSAERESPAEETQPEPAGQEAQEGAEEVQFVHRWP